MSDTKKNQKLIDDFDYLSNAASSQDCTGLIPSLPTSGEELDSYNDVYQYLPPVIPSENKEKKNSSDN